MKEVYKSILGILVVVLLFVGVSYIVQENIVGITGFVDDGYFLGAVIYIFVVTVAIVIAPVSAVPLLPLVSSMYGWVVAGLLSIIGWTLGSAIAFLISRKYGTKLIRKIVPLEKIKKIEKKVPKENLFWSVVFLRMAIPVDVLSYALGLFSQMKFRTYILATVIGVTPFAFVLAYLGVLPFFYQLIALFVAGIIILCGFLMKRNKF